MTDDFRRAIEEIKLRAPIEDVVREHVPALRKSGALWVACCPFHDEKTPSFKVDPRRGTWHCFGACSEGGDQISFVEKIAGIGFRDALEILASRTGVELPLLAGGRSRPREDDPVLGALSAAVRYYRDVLASAEGSAARSYLGDRGFDEETSLAFGLGWAPAQGQALVEHARREGLAFEHLEAAGLARKSDRGRPYDFFRGRLLIPIRDVEGRTLGFGGRLLAAEEGPKYVNTPETQLFKKGRLVYGLDQALAEARRERHLILVEGYTDVMAAHQVGLKRVGAVLGTSTTSDHAARIRRCGARRISLVFDGDEAGQRAAKRALAGLLPLEAKIEIVTLPEGRDPCDLLLREGPGEFLERVDAGREWFEFLLAGLDGLSGSALSGEVDEVLELLACLPRPVHRQSLLKGLAEHLGLPVEALREQWRTSAAGRRGPRPAGRGSLPREAPESPSEAPQGVDPGIARAFADAIGAVLLDNSLVPLLKPHAEHCEDEDLRRILEIVLQLYQEVDAAIDERAVLTALADHPARNQVAGLVAHASRASSPKDLLVGGMEYVRRRALQRREAKLRARVLELENELSNPAAGEVAQRARGEQERALAELTELLRSEKSPDEHDGSSIPQSVE